MIPFGMLTRNSASEMVFVNFNGSHIEGQNPSVPTVGWGKQVNFQFTTSPNNNAEIFSGPTETIEFSSHSPSLEINTMSNGPRVHGINGDSIRISRGVLITRSNMSLTLLLNDLDATKTYKLHFLTFSTTVQTTSYIQISNTTLIQTLTKGEALWTGEPILEPYGANASLMWLTSQEFTGYEYLNINFGCDISFGKYYITNAMAIECL